MSPQPKPPLEAYYHQPCELRQGQQPFDGTSSARAVNVRVLSFLSPLFNLAALLLRGGGEGGSLKPGCTPTPREVAGVPLTY